MLKRNLMNLVFFCMVTLCNCMDLFLTTSLFEVIRSLPIALSHWARVFRGISSPSFSRPPLIRELGNRDDRFMDSLDNSGNGRSRVVVGRSAKRRQMTQECIASPAAKSYIPIGQHTHAHTHTHTHTRARTKRYFSQCITVHLFWSPWPVKLANQIRNRPSRRRWLEQLRKGSNLFAAGCIAGTVKSLPQHPATHIPLNTTALNISRRGRKCLVLYDYRVKSYRDLQWHYGGNICVRRAYLVVIFSVFLLKKCSLVVLIMNVTCKSLRYVSTMTCCSCTGEYFNIMWYLPWVYFIFNC